MCKHTVQGILTARNFSAHKAPPRGQFHFTHSQTEFQTTKSHPSVGHQEITVDLQKLLIYKFDIINYQK